MLRRSPPSLRRLVRGAIPGSAALLLLLAPAQANELGGNISWQFRTAADRAANVAVVDLMGRQNGGFYNQWNNNYTYNTYNSTVTTTNIGGNQVNCNLANTATGNAGTTSGYAATASPSVSSAPSTSASALGNSASGATAGGSGTLAAPLNSVQDSYLSPVGASVMGTVSSAGVGQLNSGTSTSSQVLNSSQANSGSNTSASTANSSACSGAVGATASWGGRRR